MSKNLRKSHGNLFVLSLCLLVLSPVSSHAKDVNQMSVEELKAKIRAQQKQLQKLKAGKKSKPVVKNDIKDIEGEKQIRGLAKLGVFRLTLPFNPYGTVTRGEFAKWLVKANNKIFEKNFRIRLARTGESSFPDVPKSNPNWPYIQGLANAGFVVGFDDGTFRPGKKLTREEMIHMKVDVDYGGLGKRSTKPKDLGRWFSDWQTVDKRFAAGIYWDDYSCSKNIKRVFGTLKTFKAKTPVTREEAAICLWQFGGHSNDSDRGYRARTGDKALKKAAQIKKKRSG